MQAAGWYSELEGELTSIAAPPLPDDLIKRLHGYQLQPTNTDDTTLDVLRRLADAALLMTQEIMPHEALPELHKQITLNTPESFLGVVRIILSSHPRQGPSQRLRKSMAQLLFATRDVQRDANDPDSAHRSQIRTAAFLAMWSTVYAEYGQTTTELAADEYMELVFR